ncbi:MAG: citrate lyase subunit beta / citryl-CoA lyase [Gaiellaceae bacterium]|jgi:citrate lyase subunit beta/citryl-CoA lyase|nr:citrate lyase subunit beta / citryl-CoA lyase [Gaiellaceae bacterium]
MLAKAADLPADQVVVDLEDGIAVADKESARNNLAGLQARGTLAVRINGVRTSWWRDDIAAAAHADVVVVPKVESLEEVKAVIALLPAGVGLEVQIETTRGLVEVERIAAVGAPLEALVFGPGDFAASLGVPVLTIGAGASEYALARIGVAARAFGLQPVDGPYAVLADTEGLQAGAQRALAHGYDGKWVIHPDQIQPVNEAFTPSAQEVERARKIVAAADGASSVSGEMVDAATKRLAESVLVRASAL